MLINNCRNQASDIVKSKRCQNGAVVIKSIALFGITTITVAGRRRFSAIRVQ